MHRGYPGLRKTDKVGSKVLRRALWAEQLRKRGYIVLARVPDYQVGGAFFSSMDEGGVHAWVRARRRRAGTHARTGAAPLRLHDARTRA